MRDPNDPEFLWAWLPWLHQKLITMSVVAKRSSPRRGPGPHPTGQGERRSEPPWATPLRHRSGGTPGWLRSCPWHTGTHWRAGSRTPCSRWHQTPAGDLGAGEVTPLFVCRISFTHGFRNSFIHGICQIIQPARSNNELCVTFTCHFITDNSEQST